MLWQNTPVRKGEKASHNRNKPQPFVPDFMKPKQEPSDLVKGVAKHTVEDVKSLLALPRGV